MLTRIPIPVLRPFVRTLWVSDGSRTQGAVPATRERVLPMGTMQVVVRLSDDPLLLFDGIDDASGRRIGHAIVGGARDTFYVRDISRPPRSVGAQLYPGAAPLLFGVPADVLAHRHTRLEDVWGAAAGEVRERLLEAASPRRQLDVFESLLTARLPTVRGIHPAVAHALQQLPADGNVTAVVRASGYSHRRFIELFRQAVGLTPGRYGRILRFQRGVALLSAGPLACSCAEIAQAAGYSDQSHFNREFRELAGLAPGQYRDLAPASPNHVPIPGPTGAAHSVR